MDITEVVKEMCNLMPGGQSAMAGALRMSLDKFRNKLYETKGCRFFDISELEAMEDFVGKPFLAEYFAKRQGGVFTKLPDADELDSVELFNIAVNADAKKALLSLLVSKSIEDGVIDKKEEKQILNCLNEFFGSKMNEVAALLKVYQK